MSVFDKSSALSAAEQRIATPFIGGSSAIKLGSTQSNVLKTVPISPVLLKKPILVKPLVKSVVETVPEKPAETAKPTVEEHATAVDQVVLAAVETPTDSAVEILVRPRHLVYPCNDPSNTIPRSLALLPTRVLKRLPTFYHVQMVSLPRLEANLH